MVDSEVLCQQQVLGLHHVIVRVAGKLHPEATARSAGRPMPDPVGEYNIVCPCIQRPTWTEKRQREDLARARQKRTACARRPVQYQYSVRNLTARSVAPWSTDRRVVLLQLQRLAGLEGERSCEVTFELQRQY